MPTALHELYTGVFDLYFKYCRPLPCVFSLPCLFSLPVSSPSLSLFSLTLPRCRHQQRSSAMCLHSKMLRVLVFSNSGLNTSIAFFKRLVFAQGIYSTPLTRLATNPFDEYSNRTATELSDFSIALMNQ